MSNHNELPISMESDALIALRSAIDKLLTRTIQKMQSTNHDKAKMTVTLDIELIDAIMPDGLGGERPGVMPVIKHNVKTQIQLIDEIRGKMPEGYEMVWDRVKECYYLKTIRRNQIDMFENKEFSGLLSDD